MKYIKPYKINEEFRLISFEKDRQKLWELQRKIDDFYQEKFLKMVINILDKIDSHIEDNDEYEDIIDFLTSLVSEDNLFFDDYVVKEIEYNENYPSESILTGESENGTETKIYLIELKTTDLYEWLQTLSSNKKVKTLISSEVFKKMNS